jgi:hypothetical protein
MFRLGFRQLKKSLEALFSDKATFIFECRNEQNLTMPFRLAQWPGPIPPSLPYPLFLPPLPPLLFYPAYQKRTFLTEKKFLKNMKQFDKTFVRSLN